MSSDDRATFDARETRLACRALLPTLDLERATERSVRARVRDALRARRGADLDVDEGVVREEIDAFLGGADAAATATEATGGTTTTDDDDDDDDEARARRRRDDGDGRGE